MTLHRTLPPPDELLKPRDREPIIVVTPQTWHCIKCEPQGRSGAGTTVEWIGTRVEGADGRCRECGQKFWLAPAFTKSRSCPALDYLPENSPGYWPFRYRWWAREAASL